MFRWAGCTTVHTVIQPAARVQQQAITMAWKKILLEIKYTSTDLESNDWNDDHIINTGRLQQLNLVSLNTEFISSTTIQIQIICKNTAILPIYIYWVIIQVSPTRKYLYYHLPITNINVNCTMF